MQFHANVSLSCSKWYSKSNEIINWWLQKLVSENPFYTSEKPQTKNSLQTHLKLYSKEHRTACNWLFQTQFKTNDRKKKKHSSPEHKSRAGFYARAP
jgi:hypothetical protein